MCFRYAGATCCTYHTARKAIINILTEDVVQVCKRQTLLHLPILSEESTSDTERYQGASYSTGTKVWDTSDTPFSTIVHTRSCDCKDFRGDSRRAAIAGLASYCTVTKGGVAATDLAALYCII